MRPAKAAQVLSILNESHDRGPQTGLV